MAEGWYPWQRTDRPGQAGAPSRAPAGISHTDSYSLLQTAGAGWGPPGMPPPASPQEKRFPTRSAPYASVSHLMLPPPGAATRGSACAALRGTHKEPPSAPKSLRLPFGTALHNKNGVIFQNCHLTAHSFFCLSLGFPYNFTLTKLRVAVYRGGGGRHDLLVRNAASSR